MSEQETHCAWGEARECALGWARRWAQDPYDAEDIAQEALLRAWRHQGSLARPDAFAGWLATIVRNEAFRLYGRQRSESPASDSELAAEDPELLQVTDRADIAHSMRALEGHERVLLRLRYEHDLTHAAIAARLEMPEGTVKVQLHRARKKLREALDADSN
jgi:RNA polymerase sigma-70 factor (ECF subfamily)